MKPTRLALAGILSAAFFTAPAVAPAGFFGGVGTYCKDRFHDALDIVRLRGGFPRDGKAIGAKARVTTLAQLGYVSYEGTYVGMDRRGVGIVNEDRQEAGVSVFYGSYNEMVPVWGNGFLKADTDWSKVEDRRILRNLPHWDDGRQRYLSVGAEIATPLLAVDAGVYPEEVLDFALGFLIIDIYNDDELFDHHMPYREATTLPEPDEEAPFADKRQEYQDLQDRIKLEQALEAAEAIEAQEAMDDSSELPTMVSPEEDAAITSNLADEAMNELDQQMIQTEQPMMEEQEVEPEPMQDESTPEMAPAEEETEASSGEAVEAAEKEEETAKDQPEQRKKEEPEGEH